MRLRRHRVPEEMFGELSRGGGEADAVELLMSAQYSKRLLFLRSVRDLALQTGHPAGKQAAEAFEALKDLQERAPDATAAVLRHPAVGAWARAVLEGLRAAPADPGACGGAVSRGPGALGGTVGAQAPADPGGLAGIAAAAAIRAGSRLEIEVPIAEDGSVLLPSLGRALIEGRPGLRRAGDPSAAFGPVRPVGAVVRVEPAAVRIIAGETVVVHRPSSDGDGAGAGVGCADGADWQGVRPLSTVSGGRRLDLLIDDTDPYRMPGAKVTADRLTESEVAAWSTCLNSAWRVLTAHHERVADEVAAGITVLTPLVAPAHGQSSATSPLTPGAMGMSTPPDGTTLAATFAHEIQHAKLTALLDLVTLTLPDDGSRHYAPWRDDPRPVAGLLQGAYAHLGVARFWRRQRAEETGRAALLAHASFVRWRDAAAQVTGRLRAGRRLTPEGAEFAAAMTRTLDGWRDDPVPAEAVALAEADAAAHRSRWQEAHGPPEHPID